ncbi:response regulator transcription factor [Dactylosporangium sp. NPDC049525]|uniref:response regulator transcription factor n=1 Tax=Dactylosporangium sp. NPDC049525 TaxID=3154730 RepID=UPI0034174F07
MTRPVRVVVADDQALVRSGFAMILDSYDDIEVVGEAADGVEALALCRRLHPDVVLMDIRMPDMGGLEATRHLTAGPDTTEVRVLVLTTFDTDEHVYEALRAGASGFLLKDIAPRDLASAVHVVAKGDALLAPSVTRRLIDRFARLDAARAGQWPGEGPLPGLTQRETDVLAAVARGLSNVEIAGELFVSYSTVKTHVSSLLAKLGVRDRAQLVMIAYQSGLAR